MSHMCVGLDLALPPVINRLYCNLAFLCHHFSQDNLEPAQAMVAEGKLKTEIQQVFSLNEFEKAFNLLKSRRVRGKLVFKMAQ